MADIIKLLPDSVANQIAAGEVIQRPASVVKELVENSIDAGCTSVSIFVKDAGRTSIQIIDNGTGMSTPDARMAFERHATSKITDARDLFSIRTLGFRGEALASIAAVAEVKLRTKKADEDLGTSIDISASKMLLQEQISCPDGSNFMVRNLFYNTPARRKFLKTNSTELKHIVNEFHRVALTHPEIEFILHHNSVEIYNLPVSNFRQRICNVFGKNINQFLVPINADTSIVKISGLIGKPEAAKKTFGEQFFFVNQRYIKHTFLHRAVMKAYEYLLPSDAIPTYFIYFETDPESIDINIHPTKTEVKFADEQSIFQILVAALKETLGKFNIVPSLDFNIDTSIDIPIMRNTDNIVAPVIDYNPNYNPFNENNSESIAFAFEHERPVANHWEKLYSGLENNFSSRIPSEETLVNNINSDTQTKVTFQLKNRYILTAVKSGLMMIDQKRAHERILYERYLTMMMHEQGVVQRTLFPQILDLTVNESSSLSEIFTDIRALGFDLEFVNDTSIAINGYPADSASNDPVQLLQQIIRSFGDISLDIETDRREKIAKELAVASAIPYGKSLSNEEMKDLVDHLFACSSPNYSPGGKIIINILSLEEIEKRF